MRLNIFCLLSFLLLFASGVSCQEKETRLTWQYGGIVRGDTSKKDLALVFTADEFGEGLPTIIQTLGKQKIKAGFFFTGRFFRNKEFKASIQKLNAQGHYLGPHSDQHLLYCDWTKRDSLLVTSDSFEKDISRNLSSMREIDLQIVSTHFFIPPYEWWNDSVAIWSRARDLTLVSFTPGIRTNADYTYPELGPAYKSSEWIINWLKETITQHPGKLNGSIVLIHAGTDPRRKDKLYNRLQEIILFLKKAGYQFKRIDSLLKN